MSIRLVGARLMVLAAVSWTAACGTRPEAEIEAADAALNDARSAEATQFATDAMREAEASRKALDDELATQERAWFPSYTTARDMANNARADAVKAASEARTAKVKVEADRAAARLAARRATAVTTVKAMARATEPVKLTDVMPEYPEIARSAGVQGTVTIAATVATDGTIDGAKVVRSVPLLDAAALEAVKQWTYKPSMLNGKAVPANLVVNVQFVR
jgi:TonB family protein